MKPQISTFMFIVLLFSPYSWCGRPKKKKIPVKKTITAKIHKNNSQSSMLPYEELCPYCHLCFNENKFKSHLISCKKKNVQIISARCPYCKNVVNEQIDEDAIKKHITACAVSYAKTANNSHSPLIIPPINFSSCPSAPTTPEQAVLENKLMLLRCKKSIFKRNTKKAVRKDLFLSETTLYDTTQTEYPYTTRPSTPIITEYLYTPRSSTPIIDE